MMIGLLVLEVFLLSFVSALDCPVGSFNEGWSVQHQTSFINATDCCTERVTTWAITGDDGRKPETFCTMSTRLIGQDIVQIIYPTYCETVDECGDYGRRGQRMECCPEGRFCLETSKDGSSRCGLERPSIPSPENDLIYEDPVAEYSRGCHESGLSTCMTCESSCSHVTLATVDDQ